MREISINDSITLKYIPMTKLKTTTVGLYIHRPLRKEEASMNAVLPFLLCRGCRLCPDAEAVSKYLENLYGAWFCGTVTKRGEDHIIYFDAETISDKYSPDGGKPLSELLKLMLSAAFEPNVKDGAFDEAILEQEKANAKNRILASMNDKQSYASKRCIEEMCAGEAFAVPRLGTAEGVDAIGAKSLYSYYRSIITSSPIDIYICGDADADGAAELVRSYIKGMEFTTPVLPQTEILKNSSPVKNVTEEMDITQGKLAIGFRTNIRPTDADFPAFTVMNSIFGAGAHSKLFNNVREKLSLAYYAMSQPETLKGLLIAQAGIEFQNFESARDETLAQLEEIKKGNITEHEFNASVSAIINALEGYYDNPRAMREFYLGEYISGTNRDIETVKQQILAVTPEDAAKAAAKLELDTVYFLKGKGDESHGA